MSDKRKDLQEKIERYRRIIRTIDDPQVVKGVSGLQEAENELAACPITG